MFPLQTTWKKYFETILVFYRNKIFLKSEIIQTKTQDSTLSYDRNE